MNKHFVNKDWRFLMLPFDCFQIRRNPPPPPNLESPFIERVSRRYIQKTVLVYFGGEDGARQEGDCSQEKLERNTRTHTRTQTLEPNVVGLAKLCWDPILEDLYGPRTIQTVRGTGATKGFRETEGPSAPVAEAPGCPCGSLFFVVAHAPELKFHRSVGASKNFGLGQI